MRRVLILSVALVLPGSVPQLGNVAAQLTERDLPDNVQVRLVAARHSEERTVHLIAKFVTTDKDRREILVHFHSNVATPHERTLMNVIEACVGNRGPTWKPAEAEAVFSIPKNGVDGRNRKDYERCYLVSLKLKKGN